MALIRLPILFVLILFVGLPLYVKGLITGTQEGKLMDFFSWVFNESHEVDR